MRGFSIVGLLLNLFYLLYLFYYYLESLPQHYYFFLLNLKTIFRLWGPLS